MLLTVLEIAFGMVFVLGVITQLIWPLLTDAPLFPWFGKQRKHRKPAPEHPQAQKMEKAIGGKVVDIKKNKTGEGS